MATPEGKVKAQVKKIIAKYDHVIDDFWPVPSGYGESHLDCILCVAGFYCAIETKAPGSKPTARQVYRIDMVNRAKGKVFVIDGTEKTDTYQDLEDWIVQAIAKGALINEQ